MQKTKKQRRSMLFKILAYASIPLAVSMAPISADPVTTTGYSLSVFATGTSGYTHPDSIAVAGSSVFVSYTNGVAPDGTDGKSSTVVQYNMSGAVLNQYSLAGSNDGLKYDAASGNIWAIHNQDGNSFVTLLNPVTGVQSPQYKFSAAPHGGGYDDVVFLNGKTYVSASNPSVDASGKVNGGPSIASVQLQSGAAVVTGVLGNNAMATNVATGKTLMTNQTDPDSMITTPRGGLVVDTQADGQLIFVDNVGTSKQIASDLFLVDSKGSSVTVDDTVFPTTSKGFVLVSDSKNNTIYKVTSNSFVVNGAYSGGNSDSFGIIDQKTGLYTPFITGLSAAGAEAFVSSATPEPATLGLMGLAFAGLGIYRFRKSARRRS